MKFVDEEAKKLMKEKGDMFERYLRKPRNSSIGFLALNSGEKRTNVSRQNSRASQRQKINQSNYSISQITSLRTKKDYSLDGSRNRFDGDKENDSVIEGGETVLSQNQGISQYKLKSRDHSAQSPVQSSVMNDIYGENNSLDRYQVTKNEIDKINENDKEEINSIDDSGQNENKLLENMKTEYSKA